jgi:hypothetical protein
VGPVRATTHRVWRELAPRRAFFTATTADVGTLLRVVETRAPRPERVFLVGERPGGVAGPGAWAFGELPAGWSHAGAGHYLDGASPLLRYQHENGERLEVLRASAWFGAGDYSARDACAAFGLVRELIGAAFDGAALLTTPATTGRELIARTLPHAFREPVLPAELIELYHQHPHQGRTTHEAELAARAEVVPELPRLVALDGRFQYAALCWQLPIGEPRRVRARDAGDVDPMARARYRVRFAVPRDWRDACTCGAPGHAGIGLLGVRDDGAGWRYPSAPGAGGETWCDGAELRVVRAHGWHVDVLDALVWEGAHHRPLDKWAERIVRARVEVEGRAEVAPPVRALARNALRMVLLASIGALWGAPRTVTRALPRARAGELPRGAVPKRAGDLLVWQEKRDATWGAFVRPEWAACVWARARARLLDAPTAAPGVRAGALHVPAEHVVAMRTDALYLTVRPDWPDDGTRGRYSVRADIEGPIPAPATTEQLRRAVGAI